MAYDIGKITRELQAAFRLFDNVGDLDTRDDVVVLELEDPGDATNLATPENVGVLLESLTDFTAALAAERMRLAAQVGIADVIAGILEGTETEEDVKAWDADFAAWRARLVNYNAQVAKAPPGDRADILWSTTAPLLLGFYGGENSDEPQRPIDAVTPFALANQLRVADAWRDERLRLLREDIADEAKKVVTTAGGGLVFGAVALLAIVVLTRR